MNNNIEYDTDEEQEIDHCELHGCTEHHHQNEPFRREMPRIGRNDPCPCGSEKKYKKCCG